jgi:hypothetical protein
LVVVDVVVCPVSLLLLQDDVWVVVVVVVHGVPWALLLGLVAVVVEPQSFVLSASAVPEGTSSTNANSAPTISLRTFMWALLSALRDELRAPIARAIAKPVRLAHAPVAVARTKSATSAAKAPNG